MPRVLIVDDDLDQIDIRRLILEQAGHDVWTAASATEALERFRECEAESVVMDLYLPGRDEGCGLIRNLRALSDRVNIVVTTGWTAELPHLAERALVNHVLQKPFKTEKLLRLLAMLLLCLLPVGAVEFEVKAAGEMVAEVSFDTTELSLSEVSLDGKYLAHVPVAPRADLFLGRLAVGRHELAFSRNPGKVRVVAANDSVAHAPVVYTRPENGTRFTDIPLLTYCERLRDAAGEYFQYSIIFSNEDGGTSTRALMARWGRTTDIEHVYRIWPASGRTQIQSQGHNDVSFTGKYEDKHPVLFVTTRNNMVGPEGTGTVRYRPAPVVVDLRQASREKVMDEYPFTYEIARMELEKEGKLRPFGTRGRAEDFRSAQLSEHRSRYTERRLAGGVPGEVERGIGLAQLAPGQCVLCDRARRVGAFDDRTAAGHAPGSSRRGRRGLPGGTGCAGTPVPGVRCLRSRRVERVVGSERAPVDRRSRSGRMAYGGDSHVELAVKVVPRASKSEVVGTMADGALKVKVAAVPEKGKANEELRAVLARHYGVAVRDVEVIAGAGSTRKRVRIGRASEG